MGHAPVSKRSASLDRALVDARRREPVAVGEQQSEPATHAVAGDSNPPCTPVLLGQPGTHGFYFFEGPPVASGKIAHDGAFAGPRLRPREQIGATARYPSPASQSAWFFRSWLIPTTSWITTTPGQGPSRGGVAT